jgi:hypothetical protein
MNVEHYTADNICLAMGVGAFTNFDPPMGKCSTLRVLLLPSFDPEVLLTLSPRDDGADLNVVVLLEGFWKLSKVFLPSEEENVHIEAPAVVRMRALFEDAITSGERKPRVIYLDGMTCELAEGQAEGIRRLRTHVSARPEPGALVKEMVSVAWLACRHPRVRNGLSSVGRYVGLALPSEPVSAPAPSSGVAVIGDSEGKSELLKALRTTPKV